MQERPSIKLTIVAYSDTRFYRITNHWKLYRLNDWVNSQIDLCVFGDRERIWFEASSKCTLLSILAKLMATAVGWLKIDKVLIGQCVCPAVYCYYQGMERIIIKGGAFGG
jgi:hypothetical protein